MARKIQNVAVAGGRGNVGAPVVNHLLAQGFNVTVLTRKTSSGAGLPAGVQVQAVDFAAPNELQAALKGQDAVVDCTLTQDEGPKHLMDAAVAAGVYRYIPSDWSLDPLNDSVNALPVFAKRVERDAYLQERCASPGANLTWTSVANGPFLDWNLRTGFMGIDLSAKRAQLMDGGENRIVWTTLDSVGRAVAGVMLHPEETVNRPVYIQSVVKSCKEMLDHAQAALGRDGWQVEGVDAAEANNKALADLTSGHFDMSTFGTMVRYANSRPDMSAPWTKPDNALLGVPEMADAELENLIQAVAQGDKV